jgi:uncharacterized protein (DUF736 family)
MAYEMRAGQGSLFKNNQKTTDKHPTLKGKVMLPNGEVRWISAWTKVTEAGEKWISLSIGEPCQQQAAPHRPQQTGEAARLPNPGGSD